LRTHEAHISEFTKTSVLHGFFKKLIKENSFKVIYNYFINSPEGPLNFINDSHHSSWQGWLHTKRIEDICKDPGVFFSEIPERYGEERFLEFYFGMLSYYSQTVKPVVLLLDDADNFDIDIQRAILDFTKYTISLGLKSLVALRVSTWQALESDRRDYEPYISKKIDWSLNSIKSLLFKRLSNAKYLLRLRSNTKHMQVSKKEVLNAFIDLLENEQTSDFLIKTSNYNLHSLMRKISLIPNSWHFNDHNIIKTLLQVLPKEGGIGMPLWITFNLILGNYRGTFQSNDEVARCGLINCFCTRDQKHEYFTFFIRLHMLVRLKDAINERKSVRIKEIFDDYQQIFSENLNYTKVFHWTMYRLVQSGLLITKSCRRYQSDTEVNEHIESDSVYISDAGLYYINWLISRLDYLCFMKDDIDWPSDVDINSFNFVKVGMSRHRRHKQAFTALYELMKIELKMLEEILNRLTNPGDGKIAKKYIFDFSAHKLAKGRNTILFTKLMLDEYLEYLGWSHRKNEYLSEVKNEKENILNLLYSYKEICEQFSS
jgi:hypothetical protein